MASPGSWLRELREELHLTRSAVERLTSDAAAKANDESYRIRRGRLTDIEGGRAVPDIYEVASLCECYKVNYGAVLQAFGLKLRDPQNMLEKSMRPIENTRQWSFKDADRPFSLTFQSDVSFEPTRLLPNSPV